MSAPSSSTETASAMKFLLFYQRQGGREAVMSLPCTAPIAASGLSLDRRRRYVLAMVHDRLSSVKHWVIQASLRKPAQFSRNARPMWARGFSAATPRQLGYGGKPIARSARWQGWVLPGSGTVATPGPRKASARITRALDWSYWPSGSVIQGTLPKTPVRRRTSGSASVRFSIRRKPSPMSIAR